MFGLSNHLASFNFHIKVLVQRTSVLCLQLCLTQFTKFNSLPDRFGTMSKMLDNDTLNLWVIISDNMFFPTVQAWSDLE